MPRGAAAQACAELNPSRSGAVESYAGARSARAEAVRYGAETGHVGDTLFPERCTRYTFRFFGTIMAIGLLLLAARWLGILR